MIDAEACSLGRLATSGCAACANSCPRKALTADAEGLSLSAEDCSACGACVAACPQGAIALSGRGAPKVQGRAPETAGLVCPRRAASGPCLQALGQATLAALWLQGTRQILAVTGDCTSCPDGARLRFGEHIERLNQLLADRGLPEMGWKRVHSLPRGLPLITTEPDQINPQRRAFLMGPAPDQPKAKPLAQVQARGRADDPRMAFVPQIAPSRCTGCDACLRVCPEAVLSLIKDSEGHLMYRSRSDLCSGCGLCADVCDSDALTIKQAQPEAPAVALTAFRCRGCGVEVHVPTQGPWADTGLCPICTRTGHHKRLFQVLE